jgi:hypothetical protein
MAHQHHSNIREGLVAGLLGAILVAVWYTAVDVGRGEMFYTANVLGQVFAQADTMPATRTITSPAVIQYSLLHFGWFMVFGIALATLTHLATRTPVFRMGVWLALVIGFAFWLGLSYTLYRVTDQRLPWWTIFLGSMQEVPLGDEVKSPPHPPGRGRV